MAQDCAKDVVVADPVTEEERLRIACRAAWIGVWQWDLLTGDIRYTSIARAICGFSPTEVITYEMLHKVTHPDDYERTSAMAKRAWDPELRDQSEYRYRIVRADTGEVRWVKAYGEAQFAMVDGKDRAIRYIGTLQDITDEQLQTEALAGSEARLKLAIEAGQLAVWEVDVVTNTITGSRELNQLYGFAEDSTPTMDDFLSRYAPGDRERVTEESHQRISRGETSLHSEIKHIWPDGTVKWLLMRALLEQNKAGNGLRIIGVVADITEVKQHEERLSTAARELRHRLINIITVISALANRSWPAGHGEAKKDFLTRLGAIGKATDLMFSEGAAPEFVVLKRLLLEITAPYRSTSHDPFVFEGPDDVNIAKHIRPLAMAFHELCTNALKYGALSIAEGKVVIKWHLQADGSLKINWQEMMGPPVGIPEKFGLGSTLLNRLLLGAPNSITLDYNPDGVLCTIILCE